MSSKILIALLLSFLSGCSSTNHSKSGVSSGDGAVAFVGTSWEGYLDVKHAHVKAGPPNPLFVSVEMEDDHAVLWLGVEKDKYTAHRKLRSLVRTTHYISLLHLVDSGSFTEEIKFAISPLATGEADVQYLRIVNNYKREDSHELRSFSVYATGKLQLVTADSDEDEKRNE